jgi:hypothetical protein
MEKIGATVFAYDLFVMDGDICFAYDCDILRSFGSTLFCTVRLVRSPQPPCPRYISATVPGTATWYLVRSVVRTRKCSY